MSAVSGCEVAVLHTRGCIGLVRNPLALTLTLVVALALQRLLQL